MELSTKCTIGSPNCILCEPSSLRFPDPLDLRVTKFSESCTDNLTPQETTNQEAPDRGSDRAVLPCPNSGVVARMDFVARRDYKSDLDTEAIEHELYASEEYYGFWESEDRCRLSIVPPPPLDSSAIIEPQRLTIAADVVINSQ